MKRPNGDRRALLMGLVLLAVSPTPAGAQAAQVKRVAFLGLARSAIDPYRQALAAAGFVEGRNLAFDIAATAGNDDLLPAAAAEVVGRKPDAIVASGTPAALAARRATASIPIVMLFVSDPIGGGLVANLARPGGNVTGVTDFGMDIAAKRMALLGEVVPNLAKVAVLGSDSGSHPAMMGSISSAAKERRLEVLHATVSSEVQLDAAFARFSAQSVGGIIVLGGTRLSSYREKIAAGAIRARLPTIFPGAHYVDRGGLMSYGPSSATEHRLAAATLVKVLQGANPAALPVQQPSRLELVINLRTAKALGLDFPQSILLRADRVVE